MSIHTVASVLILDDRKNVDKSRGLCIEVYFISTGGNAFIVLC